MFFLSYVSFICDLNHLVMFAITLLSISLHSMLGLCTECVIMSSLTYSILRLVENAWSCFSCLPLIILFSYLCLHSLNPCHNIKATATCLNACIEDLTSLPKLYHIS